MLGLPFPKQLACDQLCSNTCACSINFHACWNDAPFLHGFQQLQEAMLKKMAEGMNFHQLFFLLSSIQAAFLKL